jgi:signal transduction histidine kinase
VTLRTRLTLAIAGITILLTGPALFAVSRLATVVEMARDQRAKQGATFLATGGLQTRLARLDQRQRSYVAIPTDDTLRESMMAARDSLRAKLVELGEAGFTQYALEASRPVEAVLTAGARADSLIQAGELEEATNYLDRTRTLFSQAQATADHIADRVGLETAAELRRADRLAQQATTTTIASLLACLALAIILGARTTRRLTRPVVRLDSAMAAVADGRFRVPEDLPYDRNDEIGSVSRSFRSMTRRLAELDQMKAEFMSIATHELKTPLNVISGYAELLEERVYGDVNERQSEALAAVRDQARILTVLVNQLLDISRLEAGGLRVQVREVRLDDLFSRIRRAFGPLAEQKHITFGVELDPSLPDAVPGDSDRLRDQVLGNILSNAVKFTPEEGSITVRARADEDALVIEVEDTGPGIPADKLPHVFEKFYQVGDHARSKGAGLGLAIAREIVEAHGGRIGASSGPGGGTTFRIDLPLDGATPTPPEPAARQSAA